MNHLNKKLAIGFSLLVLTASGCAHAVMVAPKIPEYVVPSKDKIPLHIGVYAADEFKGYKVSESRWGDTWNYSNLGEASYTQLRFGLERIFRQVETVNEKPSDLKSKFPGLQAVIEPRVDKFEFDIPFTKFQIYPARIHYSYSIFDMSGNLIVKNSVEGVGNLEGRLTPDFAENPARSATKAVEDGISKMLESILASEEVRELARKSGGG